MAKPSGRLGRSVAAVAAALAVTAATSGVAPPAAATTAESDSLVFVPYAGSTTTIWRNGNVIEPVIHPAWWPFEGDFDANPGEGVFYYNPGPGPDGILHVTPSGTGVSANFQPLTVNGHYRPLVGDFDGNAIDDVFWYAPGPAPDHLWRFDAMGGHTSSVQTVNGSYRPIVMDVDGAVGDDIIWYAPGPGPDTIWRFTATGAHTNKPVTINGRYLAIPGHFQHFPEGSPQERLIWWNPAGFDSIWTFDTSADHTSVPMTNVDAPQPPAGPGYTGESLTMPVVGTFMEPTLDSVLFYTPGAAAEVFRGFDAAGDEQAFEPPQVVGLYIPEVGDYDGNGYQDIAWTTGGRAYIWGFHAGGYTQTNVVTDADDTLPRTAYYYDPF